jgi:hypothetical protein
MLSSGAGPILQECDRRDFLGSHLLVVGTNAIAAYAIEAAGFLIGAPEETEDFDLAWSAVESEEPDTLLWDMLKSVDSTFTVNTERTFQARNAKAYEVEILVAPSRAVTLGRSDRPKPVPLPEQEWLLSGQPVDQVVACRDGTPVRIVAPDPRWFALQKLWMSEKKGRDPLKRRKIADKVLLCSMRLMKLCPSTRWTSHLRQKFLMSWCRPIANGGQGTSANSNARCR